MISVWPSIIWLLLTAIGFGYRMDKLELSYIAATTGVATLLWWGGFFDPLISKIS